MKPRILLVEDDPVSAAFLQAALTALPADVDAIATGTAARDLARASTYDLWLIDANLPDGSGAALLADLRARGGLAHAVAHTADREPATADALRVAGFSDVLVKPLTANDLHAAVRRALGARHVADAGDTPLPAASALPVWDDDRALSALAGQLDHVRALRALFLDELPAARDTIEDAVRAGDQAAMHRTLHRLRASCGFVGAARLEASVTRLQAAPRFADGPAVQDVLADIQSTLAPS